MKVYYVRVSPEGIIRAADTVMEGNDEDQARAWVTNQRDGLVYRVETDKQFRLDDVFELVGFEKVSW